MRRFAAALALAALPACAWAAVLERVEVVGGEAPAVRLFLSAPATAVTQRLGAAGDARRRVYLDLPATRGPGVPAVVNGKGPLLRIRVGQFDARTLRVVLDLADDLPFQVGTDAGTITVMLASAPARRLAAAGKALPEPPAAAVSPEQANITPPEPETPTEATTSAATEAERPEPVARAVDPWTPPLIVIDPGHGGHDPGAAGIGGIVEKDVVLEIARRLAAKLTDRLPVSVLLTRSDDSYVPIERRLAAAPSGATLFLSLHANACDTPGARGLEVFYGGGAVRPASTGSASRLAALLGRSLGRSLDAGVGGVRGDARPGMFAVLARNAVPGALVEIGYLTHPGDAARACDTSYQDMLTEALVEGIGRFLRDSAPRL